jgi:ubiquinone/menaquinone biosynthesis C-methylase UbiE
MSCSFRHPGPGMPIALQWQLGLCDLALGSAGRYTERMTNRRYTSLIQADFDRLAAFSQDEWNHNNHYHRYLLKHVPPHCGQALEVGCGSGAFAHLLATRAERVLALDVSPQMIRLALERSQQYPHITFHVADALSWEFPSDHFECIVSIATLHHMPLEEMLLKMKHALRVNGVLLILDLYQECLAGSFTNLAAIPVNLILKYLKTGRFKEPPEVRAAWAEHGKHDTYLTLSELRQRCQVLLPGVKIRKHLLWRYSLVWQKKAAF